MRIWIRNYSVAKLFRACMIEVGIIKVADHTLVNMDFKGTCDYKEARRWRLRTGILCQNVRIVAKRWSRSPPAPLPFTE